MGLDFTSPVPAINSLFDCSTPPLQDLYLRRIQSVLGSRASAARGCRRIAVNFAVAGQLEEFRQASCPPLLPDSQLQLLSGLQVQGLAVKSNVRRNCCPSAKQPTACRTARQLHMSVPALPAGRGVG